MPGLKQPNANNHSAPSGAEKLKARIAYADDNFGYGMYQARFNKIIFYLRKGDRVSAKRNLLQLKKSLSQAEKMIELKEMRSETVRANQSANQLIHASFFSASTEAKITANFKERYNNLNKTTAKGEEHFTMMNSLTKKSR